MKKQSVWALVSCVTAIMPFSASAQEFVELTKLVVDDVNAGIELGNRVANSGDTIVFGDPHNDERGTDAGAAYVFVRDGSSWVLQEKLLAFDGQDGNTFGVAVAVDGNTIVIGDSKNSQLASDAGAVYVFIKNGTSWSLEQKLTASDGAAADGFGSSVTIENDQLVVGAPGRDEKKSSDGAAYVFIRNGGQWTEQAKLVVSGTTNEFDFLGSAVSISGDTALIAAKGCCADGLSYSTGGAYVFVRVGENWSQQAKLVPSDGAWQDAFGNAVDVTGDVALIGAPQDRVNGSFSGSVYVFERTGTTWMEVDKLLPDFDGGFFGVSVTRSGNQALIGAMQDSDPANMGGAAYIFELAETGWTQVQKLFGSDGEIGDAFGYSSSLSDGTAVIGARGDDDMGPEAGAAYVFRAILFDDVPSDYWAFSFIQRLADNGITSGCGPRLYCPTNPVTRAQMAVFLERGMKGSNYAPPPPSGTVFSDVGVSDFAASFIEQLYADGITSGCGNNNYCPNAEVTRAQMAVFLLRAKYGASYSPPAATGVFNDVDLSYWAVHWIEQLAAEGITSGCGNGNYCPEDPVTRAQMAVFLVRTFGL
jgi:hypothetical protein